MTTEKELKKGIENYNINGIVNLFNELKYSNSTLNKCNAQELLEFVKKCCIIERELESKKAELKGRTEAIEDDGILKIQNNLEKSFKGTFRSALKNGYEMDKHYVIVDWIFFHKLLEKLKQKLKEK